MKTAKLFLIALFTAASISGSLPARADEKPAQAAQHKQTRIPFNGKVNAVDTDARTLVIGKEKKRTVQITPETKITRHGEPATLQDITVGEDIGGLGINLGEGRLEAVSLRVGPKAEAKPAVARKAKEKK
jgi:hypothetical protein